MVSIIIKQVTMGPRFRSIEQRLQLTLEWKKSLHSLGNVYKAKKEYAQAEKSYQQAIDLEEKFFHDGGEKEKTFCSHSSYLDYMLLADLYTKEKKARGHLELECLIFVDETAAR
jgi:tetratricopeptide (TPR) repeat protein